VIAKEGFCFGRQCRQVRLKRRKGNLISDKKTCFGVCDHENLGVITKSRQNGKLRQKTAPIQSLKP
jgi:hypothetical protein